jgi:hypothetical protein
MLRVGATGTNNNNTLNSHDLDLVLLVISYICAIDLKEIWNLKSTLFGTSNSLLSYNVS